MMDFCWHVNHVESMDSEVQLLLRLLLLVRKWHKVLVTVFQTLAVVAGAIKTQIICRTTSFVVVRHQKTIVVIFLRNRSSQPHLHRVDEETVFIIIKAFAKTVMKKTMAPFLPFYFRKSKMQILLSYVLLERHAGFLKNENFGT